MSPNRTLFTFPLTTYYDLFRMKTSLDLHLWQSLQLTASYAYTVVSLCSVYIQLGMILGPVYMELFRLTFIFTEQILLPLSVALCVYMKMSKGLLLSDQDGNKKLYDLNTRELVWLLPLQQQRPSSCPHVNCFQSISFSSIYTSVIWLWKTVFKHIHFRIVFGVFL